jgi:hypothetical protein
MRLRQALPLLTVVAMLAPAAAANGAPLAGFAANENPDVVEVRQYALTLEKAQKTAKAMYAINRLVASDPKLSAAMDAGSDTTGKKAITQQALDIDSKYPQIASIIHANGLTTREFIVVTGAIINDLGFVGMKKQGLIKAYPPNSVAPGNAALIEQNWAAFQTIGGKMSPPSTR